MMKESHRIKDTIKTSQTIRKRLVHLFKEDQAEVVHFSKITEQLDAKERQFQSEQLTKNCQHRAAEVIEFLRTIELPLLSKIGDDGAQALSVIALHANLSIMEKVLASFEQCYKLRPDDTYLPAIPSLTDRILVLKRQKQLFGTQWMPGSKGIPFLFPVNDFASVNNRRNQYGIGQLGRPIDLSNSGADEITRVPAKESDQKVPSETEYMNFARDYLD